MTVVTLQYYTPESDDDILFDYSKQSDNGVYDQAIFRTKGYKISHIEGKISKGTSDCPAGYLKVVATFGNHDSKQLFSLTPNANKTVYIEDMLTDEELLDLKSIQLDMWFPRFLGATNKSNSIKVYIYGCEEKWQTYQ